MILFLSQYPHTEQQLRDGFYQRVVNIDNFFKDEERVYLNVQLFRNFKKTKYEGVNRNEYSCNLILHFFFILKLFNDASFVYIQSLHNVFYNFILIKFIKNKYVLDLHGVVPEELNMQNQILKSKIYNLIESKIYNKIDLSIAVTKKLANHYSFKYPMSKTKYLIYAILPNNIENSYCEFEEQSIDKKINVIYSGNTQTWQNINLMFNKIKENDSDKIHYTILTGELTKMKEYITSYGLDQHDNINVLSVGPNELSSFYKKSNYGFILRDDILVNNVACPTKLIEYLNYGIIPIVLSENIGDFKELGYEYILVNDFNDSVKSRKSRINSDLIKKLKNDNTINIKNEIYSILNT